MTDRRLRVLAATSPDAAVPVLDALDTATIDMVLDEDPSWHQQVLAIALVDLLGRLFPNIDYSPGAMPAHPDLPPGCDRLSDRLDAARSHGDLAPGSKTGTRFVVHIGNGNASADLHVDATDWKGYL